MGYATIVGGGPKGRYQVEIDYGEQAKTSALQNLALMSADLDVKIATQEVKVAESEDEEAAMRVVLNQAMQTVLLESANGQAPSKISIEAMNLARQNTLQLLTRVDGARIKLEMMKGQRLDLQKQIAVWNTFEPIKTKDVWCTDYTESASGFVATIDVNGESDLTLLAAGCRKWNRGDGTIATATKLANIATLEAAKARVEAALADVVDDMVTANAELVDLKVQQTAAQDAYNAAAEKAPFFDPLQKANARVSLKISEITRLQMKKATLNLEIKGLDVDIAKWQAKRSSDSPDYGDGVMTAREVQSPAQVFWNAAVLPGWQKHKPMYRWGTITGLNYDNDTAGVLLAPAQSSAQDLNINQPVALGAVPVRYMTCNADAFKIGDRCIVQFPDQTWASPTVIGFLDNPRPCALLVPFVGIVTYSIDATYVSDPYFDDNFNYVQDVELTCTVTRTFDASIGETVVSPVDLVDFSYVIWSGYMVALIPIDDLIAYLTDPENVEQNAVPAGPLNFQDGTTMVANGQAFTFTLPDSAAVYTVIGNANDASPYTGPRVPIHTSFTASGTLTNHYDPVSGSVVY